MTQEKEHSPKILARAGETETEPRPLFDVIGTVTALGGEPRFCFGTPSGPVVLRRWELLSLGGLLQLAPIEHWRLLYPRQRAGEARAAVVARGKVDVPAAAAALMAACVRAGEVAPELVGVVFGKPGRPRKSRTGFQD